jgi:hypothetical protein
MVDQEKLQLSIHFLQKKKQRAEQGNRVAAQNLMWA